MEIVLALQEALLSKVGKDRYELWFGKAQLRWDGRALAVAVPSRFFHDWIRANFLAVIQDVCLEVLKTSPEVEFHIEAACGKVEGIGGPGGRRQDDPACSSAANDSGSGQAPATSEQASDEVIQSAGNRQKNSKAIAPIGVNGTSPLVKSPPKQIARKFASLRSFVVGHGNRLAAVSAEMVACEPGKITPLVLYGPTSVGKTHLLEGIWAAARAAGSGPATIYLSGEQFTSQFLQALRGSGMPSFRNRHRGATMLILDDLQFLAGKRATQVELLGTIDTLLRDGKQVVFAADRPPAEMNDFLPELLTRLSGGMVCRIDPPDFQTRLGIVDRLARKMELELPEDVQRFIAARITSHAREISGAICRLQATSRALGQKITLALAEEALSELVQQNSRVVRLADIQKAICKVFGLEVTSLQSDGKSKRLSQPRMLAMFLARKHTRAALSEIGSYFGRRSHSTVISAQRRVEKWVADGESVQCAEQTWNIEEALRQLERQILAT